MRSRLTTLEENSDPALASSPRWWKRETVELGWVLSLESSVRFRILSQVRRRRMGR